MEKDFGYGGTDEIWPSDGDCYPFEFVGGAGDV